MIHLWLLASFSMIISSPGLSGRARESEPSDQRGTGREFLCRQWATACAALEVPAGQTDRSLRTVRAALPAWTHQPLGATPSESSYVADDGFPAEMSVNWSGAHPELRLLFDCFGEPWSGVTTTSPRLARIREIFGQHKKRPAAPLWHSIAWRPLSTVVHKTYFGLYEWPLPQRHLAVGEAMRRLGMAAAWDDARRRVENAPGQREIEFFAVDLTDDAVARVKIYYRNHGADLDEVNRIASVALRHDAERAHAAFRTLAGRRTDAGKSALSCLAFRSGLHQVAESTTYLRLADLAANDQQAVDRAARLLRGESVDPARLHTLATALAATPLDDSRGLLALVSYRAAGRPGDITTYFRFPVYGQPAPG